MLFAVFAGTLARITSDVTPYPLPEERAQARLAALTAN